MLAVVEQKLLFNRAAFFEEVFRQKSQKSRVSDQAIPVCADIRKLDWSALVKSQMAQGHKMYDVVMMDPPWQLSSSNPSRGVAIAYDSLADEAIKKIPIKELQTEGFCFIWVINAKYRMSVKLLEHWGYKLVDEITWVWGGLN